MTITTLEYIHRLLKRKVASLEAEYCEVCDARRDLDYDDPQYPAFDKACRDANSVLCDARDVLIDFESNEW